MSGIYDLPYYILLTYADDKITPLKLQKLLYYVKVWGIVAGEELYQGDFKKWTHGPVNTEVYHHYKSYGRNPIPAPLYAQPVNLEGQRKELIDFIVSSYLPYSAISLSAMTHDEAPWQETPKNQTISDDRIRNFYTEQLFARNFKPFDPYNKPYYPVQSNSWYAYVLDMTPADVERHKRFTSYQAYQKRREEARAGLKKFDQVLDQIFDV